MLETFEALDSGHKTDAENHILKISYLEILSSQYRPNPTKYAYASIDSVRCV